LHEHIQFSPPLQAISSVESAISVSTILNLSIDVDELCRGTSRIRNHPHPRTTTGA